jgi:hypothetical protein
MESVLGLSLRAACRPLATALCATGLRPVLKCWKILNRRRLAWERGRVPDSALAGRQWHPMRPLAAVVVIAVLSNQVVTADEPNQPTQATAPAKVSVAGVDWYTDYYEAYRDAAANKRFLLINVTPTAVSSAQQSAERYISTSARVRQQMEHLVLLRVPTDATIKVEGETKRLLSFGSFGELHGGSGFVLIDLRNDGEPYYGYAVSVLPYSSGKYYHFRPDYLSTVLSIPAGTLSQRTMIWAVRIHPEAPQSTFGTFHPALADGATHQASYQANVGEQGHQNFESRFHSLSSAAGSSVSEVCAESWPGQNLIDSCLDCVDSWRHSSGHWRGVSGRHRAFGYDIRRGRNGIWYGTGIFAD